MLGDPPQNQEVPSPPGVGPRRQKRKRKSLSCYQCRQRKLKCDRAYPSCSRCQQSGQAASCHYVGLPIESTPERLNPSSIRSTAISRNKALPEWAPSTDRITQSRHVPQIESKPLGLEAAQPAGTLQIQGEVASVLNSRNDRLVADSFFTSPRESNPTETMIFKGENFKTQYYGGTNPISLIAQFPELRLFMKDTITHGTSLPRVQRDLKALQIRWKSEKTSISPLINVALLELLPDEETVDRLVKFYFDTFESTYRILHGPTFWTEYQTFWQDQSAASPSFVVILLLILSTVKCVSLQEQTTYIGDSSAAREWATLRIEQAEIWLERQSRKHAFLAIWQIRCLLQLAKQVNTVKKKRTWTSAGTLVREAMSAGFHRDASMLGTKASVFDQEMRRRLWATMTELELQASIDRGMPSATAGILSDSANVVNIDDEEINPKTEMPPPAQRPWSEITSSSFLHVSRDSFDLRVTLNTVLNNSSSDIHYEDVLNYEEKIMQSLDKIPPWTPTQAPQANAAFPSLARTLLDVQLRQFLMLLHGPFARQTDTNSRYSLSKMICLNNAAKIIEQHSQLINSGHFMLLLLRHDVFRAALAICHNYHVSNAMRGNLYLLNLDRGNVIHYVDTALSMLGDRITRLGTGYTHYWYISAAIALVRASPSPSTQTGEKQEAVERVTRQYVRVLACQEDFVEAKERILSKKRAKEATEIDEPLAVPGDALPLSLPQIPFDDPDSNEFFFGDPSAWTFDNLWSLDI